MKRLAIATLSLMLLCSCASTNSSTNASTGPSTSLSASPSTIPATDPASMVSQLTSNPLVSNLMSTLGLNATQAIGGAGALLGLAQNTLPQADWSAITSAIPGTDALVKTAASLGGITGKASSLADLSGPFTKLGLSTDQVTKLVPAVTDYVGKSTSAATAAALAGVLD
jgi:hypothetical protein